PRRVRGPGAAVARLLAAGAVRLPPHRRPGTDRARGMDHRHRAPRRRPPHGVGRHERRRDPGRSHPFLARVLEPERPRVTSFAAVLGPPPAVTAAAPGRVNLIGEHTDYNDGFVLPTVIPQRTTVALAPRADRRVRLCSDTMAASAEYLLGEEVR